MKKQPNRNVYHMALRPNDHPGKRSRKMIVMTAALMVCTSIASCAHSDDPRTPRRQIASCPEGLILICTSRQPPSRGGDEDIPLYEDCTCKSNI